MTIKQGDQLWVPVTVAGVIGEDGYRFWTDDTWFRDGDQLPLHPALVPLSRWLAGDELRINALLFALGCAVERLAKPEIAPGSVFDDLRRDVEALGEALEQPV